jgi:hypothetical protein
MEPLLKFKIGDVVEWWPNYGDYYGTYLIKGGSVRPWEYDLLTIKSVAAETIGQTFPESILRINAYCRLFTNGVQRMIDCL